ncbi:hypothetical protein [Pelagibacterium montanilacus]|uniref:hypothetical protein n=1 Tax=Pelagibacterium montanilacus TaxID=2185280 RepID=UPI000F8C8AB8|nr:hypothetical protein [Pelagibacterium montanilacus]
MINWIQDYSDALSFLANFGMLLVWLTYLHVFLVSYRRQTLPKIVINRAAGSDLSASCFVSNMSSEALYVELIVVRLEADDQEWKTGATDVSLDDREERPSDPRQLTRQGTLRSGDYMSIGTFNELFARLGLDEKSVEAVRVSTNAQLSIKVFADYASEDLLIGAERVFTIDDSEDRWILEPKRVETHQIRSRRDRRAATREFQQFARAA